MLTVKLAQKTDTPTVAKKRAKTGAKKEDGTVTEHSQDLSISETGGPSTGGIDVLKEYEKSTKKRSATFVVVGKFGWLHPM